jgi:ankyrin repeat protein
MVWEERRESLKVAPWLIHLGHLETVKTFLRYGANPEASDLDGSTSLYVACQNGFKDIVKVLLDHGANPGIK